LRIPSPDELCIFSLKYGLNEASCIHTYFMPKL
jgi:hypothetical protein